MTLYPLTFQPIFKERIWGGRNLATLHGKTLPPARPIGESWEISDRPGDDSVIARGPLHGKTLHWLMEQCPAELLGPRRKMPPRFPLLIKIIDARETLSLQVHPPAEKAAQLGGEPKTEMWYVAQAAPGAELFAGLKKGVCRAEFESKLARQTVTECFHRIPVKAGDAMFMPSGRVHALGAGIVVFEIQQNSDTTYRVFDWNRVDEHGKGRDLHVEQSLASIDFVDIEPSLLPRQTTPAGPGTIRPLVKNELFEVSLRQLARGESLPLDGGRMEIIGVTEGALRIASGGDTIDLSAGQFCLIPAQCLPATASVSGPVSFLQIYAG
ncbi:MAG: type I phosphomannose isomerase catalytic subunit [Verrucomicrobiota bacterium]|jgi:mannose-6-phosphate isomerase